MKPHLSEDTDDENCDDPIRLFGNDTNAVYFGSKLHGHADNGYADSRWTLVPTGNDEFCQPPQDSMLREPIDDLIEKLQGGTTSECDISLLCVKLVDCGKFPWYFKNYTQQIMQKINSIEQSDSDYEIDIENVVDDSDDCFIVENLEHVTKKIIKNDQNCIKTVKSIESPAKVKKKIDINKCLRRDDKEIQIALSKKNMFQVDFKRNQGLVGMKITRKIGPNTTPNIITDRNLYEKENTKQKCVEVNEKYLNAADKTLSSFGTQLIPIVNDKENNTAQRNINNEKHMGEKPALVKSSSVQNMTVQFEISKISEKLINDLKTKKTNNQSSEDKTVTKVSNESLKNDPDNKLNIMDETQINSNLTIIKKTTGSSTEVISLSNFKMTNKYKNDQIKSKNCANHSSLIGLLVTNNNKDDNMKEKKCTKQKKRDNSQSITTKLDKKPRNKIKKQKYEPKSPILHCSTVPKKFKQEIPLKTNEKDKSSNLSQEPTKVKKLVDKLSNPNSCNEMHEDNRLKNVIPNISHITKPLDITDKQALQNQPCVIPDKTICKIGNINAKSLIVSDKIPKNCNEFNKTYSETKNFHNSQTMPTSQNKTREQTVLYEIRQDTVKEHTIQVVSDTNPNFKAPNKNYKPVVSKNNVFTTTTIAPTSGSNSALSNQYANYRGHGSYVTDHNTSPRRMNSTNSDNSIDVPIQNRASAIILKSNNHPKLPFKKIRETPLQTTDSHPYRPMAIPNHTQQRFIDPPPPYPIFYPPMPSGNNSEAYQNYFPCPTNSVPNQFSHPSHGLIAQQLSNPTQDLYRDYWLPHNLAPLPPTRTPVPPVPPVPPTNISPKNVLDMNKYKDYSNLNRASVSVIQSPKSQNSISTPLIKNNSSIIGINNDGLVKKINIVAMPNKTKFDTKIETVNVQQITNPQITSLLEDTKIITTKTAMSKELDKLSLIIDENINDFEDIYPAKIDCRNKKEKAASTSKKPGQFETLNSTMNNKEDHLHTKAIKGYSPPILPIPTYEKVLDRVASNSQIQNRIPKIPQQTENVRSIVKIDTKPMRKIDFVKCCKRKFNNAWNNDEETRKREDAKKISLDEYKKRILKNNCVPEQKNKIAKNKYNNSGKRPNVDFKIRKNVDCNIESDLGYDSDSTVVL